MKSHPRQLYASTKTHTHVGIHPGKSHTEIHGKTTTGFSRSKGRSGETPYPGTSRFKSTSLCRQQVSWDSRANTRANELGPSRLQGELSSMQRSYLERVEALLQIGAAFLPLPRRSVELAPPVNEFFLLKKGKTQSLCLRKPALPNNSTLQPNPCD